jgi:hypothetical protein
MADPRETAEKRLDQVQQGPHCGPEHDRQGLPGDVRKRKGKVARAKREGGQSKSGSDRKRQPAR